MRSPMMPSAVGSCCKTIRPDPRALDQFTKHHPSVEISAKTMHSKDSGHIGSAHALVTKRPCLLYTSDAADEEDSVDLGGRRIIKKKKKRKTDPWSRKLKDHE
eukprot:TRINITY_DN3672_c0_g1_i3.p1 TRINITY_DN3672_c0_g1~~TRINITY_DN3672_c0_g1_i3.p1  ORF type:complete len:103 (+),score=17.98 TRINITY_DN3672_c0_g1_i3:140-448(+)